MTSTRHPLLPQQERVVFNERRLHHCATHSRCSTSRRSEGQNLKGVACTLAHTPRQLVKSPHLLRHSYGDLGGGASALRTRRVDRRDRLGRKCIHLCRRAPRVRCPLAKGFAGGPTRKQSGHPQVRSGPKAGLLAPAIARWADGRAHSGTKFMNRQRSFRAPW
jgi:hypothetical protein